ncbi:hypothetical protein P7C70_g8302, partial [Phenoliferia sp. Uapishka_3]
MPTQGPFSTGSRNSSMGSFEDWVESEDEVEREPGRSQGLRSLVSQDDIRERAAKHKKERNIRWLMLGCACCLSVGSHFGSYVLGPIKSRLKTTEGGFASLVSASQLVNTVTPLFSGFLVPKIGAARCGLLATGAVMFGQLVVVWTERNGLNEGAWTSYLRVGHLSIISCPLGIGPSPLLLVVVVPRLVDRHHVSTALGIHKSAEMAGTVIVQGVCAWLLSSSPSQLDSAKAAISLFLILSSLQLVLVTFWWRHLQKREEQSTAYGLLPPEDTLHDPIYDDAVEEGRLRSANSGSRSEAETRRGKFAMAGTAGVVVSSWAVFVFNLWRKG